MEKNYKILYQTTKLSQKETSRFIIELNINKITEVQLIMMEDPIREEEIKLAMTRMKNTFSFRWFHY